MQKKDWILFVVLQVLTVPVVIALFRFAPLQRKYVAVIAGTIFLSLGAFMLRRLWTSGLKWKSLTFWVTSVHLFCSSIPMVATRLFYFDKDFTQILILGMPGPIFHIYSERIFVAVFVATLLDWLLLSRFQKA